MAQGCSGTHNYKHSPNKTKKQQQTTKNNKNSHYEYHFEIGDGLSTIFNTWTDSFIQKGGEKGGGGGEGGYLPKKLE